MIKSILIVFFGGGLGCIARYLIGRMVLATYTSSFPIATLISNTVSCILLGFLAYYIVPKLDAERNLYLFAITGFCGGLSTFSTFSYETISLLQNGFIGYASLNVLLSLLVGMGVLFIIYMKYQS